MSLVTIEFDPALPLRFGSLRSFCAHRHMAVKKAPKEQASDMGMSASTLSRKLNPQGDDTQRFNVDDLESWLDSTGDGRAIVAYLAAKYLDDDEARYGRLIARVETIAGELQEILPALKRAKR